MESAVQQIEQSIASGDKTSQLTTGLQHALSGLSATYPGLQPIVKGWGEAWENKSFKKERIYKDINTGEMRKALAALYALCNYPKLPGIKDYYLTKGLNPDKLNSAAKTIFDGLKKTANINFQLPLLGQKYNESQFNLVDKNFGPIHDIDTNKLTKILLESMDNADGRPIIDVVQLGLPNPPTDTEVTFSYPAKAEVGILPKNKKC